ncbi:uncharacterized protein LOC128641839 [Bombina bombina]|uniref:uncharacterized protein LOC128641839 n=1 Tax=Bombina bombina TaxID=8345 RepID=UPI00235B15D2|nr:uncharacterized protein LOC128641839 [Bombina bombina]
MANTPEQLTALADDLRIKFTTQYTPGSTLAYGYAHQFQRIILQLYGLFGHGKTSLINLCLSVVRNKPYEDLAGSGWTDGLVIKERREHWLTNTVIITDNRGFIKIDDEEITEASAQLASLRILEEGVIWNRSTEEKLDLMLAKYNTSPTDFIVPVIVHRGTTNMSEEHSNNMRKFISRAFDVTSIFPIVLIMEAGESLDKISNTFSLLGVSHVCSLQNFSTEKPERTPETDAEIMNFLTVCINEADRGLRKRQRLGKMTEYKRQVKEQMRMELELERERVRKQMKGQKHHCSHRDEDTENG